MHPRLCIDAKLWMCLLSALFWAMPETHAASRTINAGEQLTLTEDLVLSNDDVLEINGSNDKRVVINANGKQIKSHERWAGRAKIQFCDFKRLGAAPVQSANKDSLGPNIYAISLRGVGKSSIAIEHCSFSECGTIYLENHDESAAAFRFNVIHENSLVPAVAQAFLSRPVFETAGFSAPPKLFQGNEINKGFIKIEGNNWRIGGTAESEANILIGLRAGIVLTGQGSQAVGNYVHVLMPEPDQGPKEPYWSQVFAFSSGPETSAERNIFRGGQWVVRGVGGQFYNNLVLEMAGHQWLQSATGQIHHNIFAGGYGLSGLDIIEGSGAEIYNNIFDGGELKSPAISVAERSLLKSLRSNIFYNFKGPTIVAGAWNEKPDASPARMAYADYNLFWNPRSPQAIHYALSVPGKNLRKDDGFGLNDISRGGPPNQQADPKFKGPLPGKFPFSDEAIKQRKTSVSHMLAQYRKAYTVTDDSPCCDSGDRRDGGETNDIGPFEVGKHPPPPTPPTPKK